MFGPSVPVLRPRPVRNRSRYGPSGHRSCRQTPMDRRNGMRPQQVLVVDDSPDIRELWRMWLNFWGFAVQEAGDGAEAVDKAQLNPPDLILMDLWMPVLD